MDFPAPGNGDRALNLPTRGRPQLSCTPCNRRKLKCDRARPCDNCVKRRESDKCVYPAVRDHARASKRTKKRLDRLESLVMGLIDRSVLQSRPSLDGEQQSLGGSRLHDSDRHRNLGSTNESLLDKPSIPSSSSSSALWESVLLDIAEIRSYFEEHELDFREQEIKVESSRNPLAGINILHTSPGECDMDTLLSSLLSRSAVDLLIENYFGMTNHSRPIIHPKNFLREYERFWKNPYDVSKMWVVRDYAARRTNLYSEWHRPETISRGPRRSDGPVSDPDDTMPGIGGLFQAFDGAA
ncbi:hypothetical protein VTN96DRAFT_14 [Rasamsonia emersonii]